MAAKIVDLTGQKFGRLLVLERLTDRRPNGATYSKYNCVCECGNFAQVDHGHIKSGTSTSCGCFRLEQKVEQLTTHGKHGSPGYYTWCSMKERCLNTTSKDYNKYGGIGVRVCERWLDSFDNFLEDMGPKPEGKTLNRINSCLLYSKETCEWATLSIQAYDTKKRVNSKFKTGVIWRAKVNYWQASISYKNETIVLYTGQSYADAVIARCNAELKYFGFIKP